MTHDELEIEVRRLKAKFSAMEMQKDGPARLASEIQDALSSEEGFLEAKEALKNVPAPSAEAPKETPAKKKKGKKGKSFWVAWTIGLASVGLVIGVAVILLLKFVNGPVDATATMTTLDKERAKAATKPDTNVFSGKYIELTYPSVFDTVNNTAKNPNAMDEYYISSNDASTKAIAMGVFNLPSEDAEDDSSYKYREINPALYKHTSEKVGKEQVELMSKADGSEVTLFWVHKGKILNLSVTSGDPGGKPAEYMKVILPKLRWKQ